MRRGPAAFLLICILIASAYGAGKLLTDGLDRVTGFSPAHRTVAPPTAGPPPLASRVVLVLVDGLRADDTPFLPTLDFLAQKGAALRLTNPSPGFQGPAAATLLTGTRPESHGVLFALPRQTLHTDSIPAAARRAQLTVGGAGAPSMGALLRSAIPDWIDAASPDLLQKQLPALLGQGGPRLVILHTDFLYKEGLRLHTADRRQSEYLDRLADLDALMVNVLEPIDWKTTAVVVAGIVPVGNSGVYSPTQESPVVMAGPGIHAGFRGRGAMPDMAPTLAALAGTPVPLANQGWPLLGALQASGERPTDLIVQRTLESRKVLTESALAALGVVQRVPDPPVESGKAGAYRQALDQQLHTAEFDVWKQWVLSIWYYPVGALIVVLLYLIAVWRQPFGGPVLLGTLTYGAAFHLIFFLTGGSYSAAMAGLDAPDRLLGWGLATRSAGAMLIAVLMTGYLLSRKGFKKRGYLAGAACHLCLSTAVLIALPVAVMVLLTGGKFPISLPATGRVVWFFAAGLQVMAIGYLSPVWAGLAVSAATVARRLWPVREVGDPEQNVDKVVRLRALRRSRQRATPRG